MTTKGKVIILPSAYSVSKAGNARNRQEKTADERLFITCAVLFSLGTALGAFAISGIGAELNEYIRKLCDIKLSSAKSDELYVSLLISVSQSAAFLILSYLMSYCAFGCAVILPMLFVRGAGIGIMLGHIYSLSNTSALIIGAALYAPVLAIAVIALLLFSVKCVRASRMSKHKNKLLHSFACMCAVTFISGSAECFVLRLISAISA